MNVESGSLRGRDPHQTPMRLALRRIFTQFTIEIDANPDLAGNEIVALGRLRNHFLLSADLYPETIGTFHFSTRFDYAHLVNTRRGQLLNPALPVHLREDPDISTEHYRRIERLRARIDRARDESDLPGVFEPGEAGRVGIQMNQVARLYRDSSNFRHCVEEVQRAAIAREPARALLGLREGLQGACEGPATPPSNQKGMPEGRSTDSIGGQVHSRVRQPPQPFRSGDFVMGPPLVRQRLEAKPAHEEPPQRERSMREPTALHRGPLVPPEGERLTEETLVHPNQTVICSRIALDLPEQEQYDLL